MSHCNKISAAPPWCQDKMELVIIVVQSYFVSFFFLFLSFSFFSPYQRQTRWTHIILLLFIIFHSFLISKWSIFGSIVGDIWWYNGDATFFFWWFHISKFVDCAYTYYKFQWYDTRKIIFVYFVMMVDWGNIGHRPQYYR